MNKKKSFKYLNLTHRNNNQLLTENYILYF